MWQVYNECVVTIEDIHLGPQLSLGMCNDSVLFLRCVHVLPQRWVDFRVVTGKLNYYSALRALCSNAPPVERFHCSCAKCLVYPFPARPHSPSSMFCNWPPGRAFFTFSLFASLHSCW